MPSDTPPQDEPLPLTVMSLPGIQRDGTDFDTDAHVGGEWVRWVAGRARKIGGYRSVNRYIQTQARAINEFTRDSLTYLHLGSATKVERLYMDGSLNTSLVYDRTPSSGFTADDNNMWQFAVDTSTVDDPQIIAQVAPNLRCLCNSTGGELFYGDLLATSALTVVPALNLPAAYSATGGVVSLHPYMVAYGSDGFVMWSVPGNPIDFVNAGAGNASVTRQKIQKILPLRGGAGNSPSGLIWSTDSLLVMSYVGGTPVFSFTTLSGSISVFSPNSIVELDGIYYWIASDRFLMFNGVVRDVPNTVNSDFFFENVNYVERMKTFAFTVPRYGEIWWCFAKGDSEEPNHAVVLNTRDGTWYDTPLPGDGRSAGVFMSVFRRPVMLGVDAEPYLLTAAAASANGTGYVVGDILTIAGGVAGEQAQVTVATVNGGGGVLTVTVTRAGEYSTIPTGANAVTGGSGTGATLTLTFVSPRKLWVHEYGVNEADGLDERPIHSWFETSDIAEPVRDKYGMAAHVDYVVPDFVQTGDMTCTLVSRANARCAPLSADPVTFSPADVAAGEQLVPAKTQARELRVRFDSNVINGDYRQGKSLAYVRLGDARMTR